MTIKDNNTPSCNAKSKASISGGGGVKRSSNDPSGSAPKKGRTTSSIPPALPLARVTVVKRVTPNKSPRDPNEYRVLKLSNGLTMALISRKNAVDAKSSSRRNGNQLSCRCLQKRPSCFDEAFPACHFLDECRFIDEKYQCLPGVYTTTLSQGCLDPEDHTSIAVAINAGGYDDPPAHQGLAHFCEHMVHYGSERFPEENAISQLVFNFGIYNATTRPHTTSYYNQVPNDLLDQNLERFADMLAQPLFKLGVLEREVNAVDDEFYLRLPAWRKHLLQTHVTVERNEHPVTRFLCGSLETLGNVTEVQNAMRGHHQRNYVASAMTLSMNSTKSLEEMEAMVLRHFSKVQTGERLTFSKTLDDNKVPLVFQPSQYVYLQGLSSAKELSCLWHLPPEVGLNDRKHRVIPLVLRLVSDTNDDTLNRHLSQQGLVMSMLTGFNATRYCTALELRFALTDKGALDTEQVVQSTFDYLNFLKTAVTEEEFERVFHEMKIASLKEFHYGNQQSTLETTKDLSMRLQYVDSEADVLMAESWRDSVFSFQAVQNLLGKLTQENLVLIETLAKGVSLEEKGPVKIAPHTGAKFVTVKRKSPSSAPPPPPKFAVPKNRYMDLDLQALQGLGAGDGYVLRCPENCGDIQPQRLKWKNGSENDPSDKAGSLEKFYGTHYGHDSTSHDPFYALVKVRFISPLDVHATARTHSLSWLWCACVMQSLDPVRSEMSNAGFELNLQASSYSVAGFPRDIDKVMNIVISHVMEHPITPCVFYRAQQHLLAQWDQYTGDSQVLTMYLLKSLRFQEAEFSLDFTGILKTLTLEDLQHYVQGYKRRCFAIVELLGNTPLRAWESIGSHLEKMPFAFTLDLNPNYFAPNWSPEEPSYTDIGETCLRVKNMASTNYTTMVTNVYNLGPAFGSVPGQIQYFQAALFFMNCQAFLDLRTKQQLGYSVFCQQVPNQNARFERLVFLVSVTATATKWTPCELNQKIDQFLAEYSAQLENNVSEEMFETMLKVTCLPKTVKKAAVVTWFKEHFGQDFGRNDLEAVKWKCIKAGIKKQSVQVLTGNADCNNQKVCECELCQTVRDPQDWVPGTRQGSQLLFAKGKGISDGYFVTSRKF